MTNNDNFVDSSYGLRRSTRKRRTSSVKSGNKCKTIKVETTQKSMEKTLSVDESFIHNLEEERGRAVKNEAPTLDAEPQSHTKQVRSEQSEDFSDCNISICDETVRDPTTTKL